MTRLTFISSKTLTVTDHATNRNFLTLFDISHSYLFAQFGRRSWIAAKTQQVRRSAASFPTPCSFLPQKAFVHVRLLDRCNFLEAFAHVSYLLSMCSMRSMRSMRGGLFPVVEGPCKRYCGMPWPGTFFAFYACYAWWIHFPQSGARMSGHRGTRGGLEHGFFSVANTLS